MGIKLNPDSEDIRKAIQKLSKKGKTFSGVCYRCTEPGFAGEIISGRGSQLYGARWTPKNSFPAVYLCDTPEAALEEYLARARRMKIPDHKSLPMVMAGIKVKLANLLDLTNADVAAVIDPFLGRDKIHWRSIQDRREAVSQAIGRAIRATGFSGLIAPSHALPGSKTLIVFPENLTPKEELSVPDIKHIA